jgi:hypothetical protein
MNLPPRGKSRSEPKALAVKHPTELRTASMYRDDSYSTRSSPRQELHIRLPHMLPGTKLLRLLLLPMEPVYVMVQWPPKARCLPPAHKVDQHLASFSTSSVGRSVRVSRPWRAAGQELVFKASPLRCCVVRAKIQSRTDSAILGSEYMCTRQTRLTT